MIQRPAQNALTKKTLLTKIINVLLVLLSTKNAKLAMLKISVLLASIKESMFSKASALSAFLLILNVFNAKKKTSVSLALTPTLLILKAFVLYALILIKIVSNV